MHIKVCSHGTFGTFSAILESSANFEGVAATL